MFTESIEYFCRLIKKLVHTKNVQLQLKTNLLIDQELNAFLISHSFNFGINKMSLVQKVLLRLSQKGKLDSSNKSIKHLYLGLNWCENELISNWFFQNHWSKTQCHFWIINFFWNEITHFGFGLWIKQLSFANTNFNRTDKLFCLASFGKTDVISRNNKWKLCWCHEFS